MSNRVVKLAVGQLDFDSGYYALVDMLARMQLFGADKPLNFRAQLGAQRIRRRDVRHDHAARLQFVNLTDRKSVV